ncbi:MAG: helix-turn-helix domain-containing protein [Chthoniobacteraceae bacterium]
MTTADALLTAPEVATLLNVSVCTVRRLVARKKLMCVDLGYRTKRFRPVDVERLKTKLSGGGRETWL